MGVRNTRADKHFEVDENIRGFAICMQEITGTKSFSYFFYVSDPFSDPEIYITTTTTTITTRGGQMLERPVQSDF